MFRNSPFRLEKLCWLLIVSGAIYFTIKDSIRTVNDFLDEETVTKVTIDVDESTILPNPTICVELGPLERLDHGDMDVANYTLMAQMLKEQKDKILHYFGQFATKIKEKRESTRLQSEIYLDPESHILKPILFIATNLIAAVVSAESGLYPNGSNLNWTFLTISERVQFRLKYKENATIPTESIRLLYNFFVENQISLGEVLKTTGMYLCTLMELQVAQFTHYSKDYADNDCQLENEIDWCQRASISWLGNWDDQAAVPSEYFNFLCIKPPISPTPLNFSTTYDSVKIHLQPQKVAPNILASFRPKVNFDFKRYPVTAVMSNVISVRHKEHLVVNLEMTNEKRISTRQQPCSEHRSQLECKLQYRADYIHRKCRCYPLTMVFSNCSDTVCSKEMCPGIANYSDNTIPLLNEKTCAKAVLSGYNDPIYKLKCLRPCFHQSFAIRLEKDLNERKYNCQQNRTQIVLKMGTKSYLNIKQSLVMDKQTFVSNLGGNWGLYLGGSFIGLIHLITSLVRFIVGLVVSRNEEMEIGVADVKDNKQKPSVVLKRYAVYQES